MKFLVEKITESHEQNKDWERAYHSLEKDYQALSERYEILRKMAFGVHSEKTKTIFNPDQTLLFNEAELAAGGHRIEDETVEIAAHKRKKKKTKGLNQEELDVLPHEEILQPIPKEQRICPKCGTKMVPMGKEKIREELIYIPAQIKVRVHYRETYECRECRKNGHFSIRKSFVPQPVLPHCKASASTIAHIMEQKYVFGVPLYRQEREWTQIGIHLDQNTMGSWIIRSAAAWFKPIVDRLHAYLLQEDVIQADETTVQVLKEAGRKNTSKSYMWVFMGGEFTAKNPIRIYQYQETRKGANAQTFLSGFSGALLSDGYQGYNSVDNVKRFGCWSHVRRKFVDSLPQKKDGAADTIAGQCVLKINKLFEIEDNLRDCSPAERQKQRMLQSKPVVEDFFTYIESNRDIVLPKGNLGKAISYAINQRTELTAFLEDGNVPIHNNACERSVRAFCIGRRAWLFAGSPKGADASASIYSLAETAKANELNVFKYFAFILNHLPNEKCYSSPETLDNYLPWTHLVQKVCREKENKEPEL